MGNIGYLEAKLRKQAFKCVNVITLSCVYMCVDSLCLFANTMSSLIEEKQKGF